ncbi:NAD(P)/FAD-dependent oxidoreductase [Fusobacterium gastrosuis]|uniref:NAD(P)/FAD-dependent oxidoreductase n=1 Tax=Fusobacterium gastrosuis TaxID=1755100 RepID=UPI001F5037AD|nr:NAD(P)/FAD-dependent oxidoreductase [Fusobacterium gastrosuis]MDD7410564.1 NAD(P)/FAD-dependent oxidoreductase [Fusobacteriaceae bacterium]MDY5713293.1 NAD(P)/FAD-dependent oxidoreductase [Fusobacterium gastrosuis]
MIDVAVIGTGIMGAAVARELSKYELNILILDKDNDVSCGTTKANSAIVHAGYDAKEGSLMAKYNVAGNAMYEELCKEVDAPFRKVGSYVLAFSEKEREHLELLYKRGLSNGVPELEIIEAEEIQKREPHVSKEAVAALYAGTAGITGPWELAIKLVENAMENGAELKLNAEVVNIEKVGEYFKLTLKNGEIIETKTVINAAGVYADILNNMISKKTFKITPRIGEYYLLDKVQGYLTDSVIFQCPTEMGKGILVAKTAHGNIIAGPTASDVEDREDVGNTQEGFDTIKQFAVKSIKDINFRDNIRNFSGLRAEADTGDFILGEAEDVKGFFNMAGTKSPGLSSAPAMAIDLAEMVVKSLGNISKKENFIKNKKHIYFIELSPEEKAEVIKKDPRYGRIICRCENITEGEIVDVIHRKAGGRTLNGIKRRCRPGAGRCQGGFCGPRVQEILARELNLKLDDIVLEEKGSYILTGETK